MKECRFGAVTLQQTHVKIFKDDCPKDDDAANYIKLMFPLHFLHSFLYFLSPRTTAHSLGVLEQPITPSHLFHIPITVLNKNHSVVAEKYRSTLASLS